MSERKKNAEIQAPVIISQDLKKQLTEVRKNSSICGKNFRNGSIESTHDREE